VLELVAEEVAHAELGGLVRYYLAAATALVAHAHEAHLPARVAADRSQAHDLVSLVLEACVLGLGLFHDRNAVEAGREHVEGEAAAGGQVAAHALEAGELVLHLDQVLEGAKGGEDQAEAILAQVEVLHARPRQPQRRERVPRGERVEHALRCIDAGARNAQLRDRQQNAPRAAAELEHGCAGGARQLAVELDIARSAPDLLVDGVVVARGDAAVRGVVLRADLGLVRHGVGVERIHPARARPRRRGC
jgi:hypothetical protein